MDKPNKHKTCAVIAGSLFLFTVLIVLDAVGLVQADPVYSMLGTILYGFWRLLIALWPVTTLLIAGLTMFWVFVDKRSPYHKHEDSAMATAGVVTVISVVVNMIDHLSRMRHASGSDRLADLPGVFLPVLVFFVGILGGIFLREAVDCSRKAGWLSGPLPVDDEDDDGGVPSPKSED